MVVESNQTLANHEVPQGYSPAEDGAGSLTPFGMTISISHTPSELAISVVRNGTVSLRSPHA